MHVQVGSAPVGQQEAVRALQAATLRLYSMLPFSYIDAPVSCCCCLAQVLESAADLGAPRLTCSCRNLSDLASIAHGCLHTQCAQLVTLPQPGPAPPVHVLMPRGSQTPRSAILPGDYFWLQDHTFVACAAQTSSIRCTRSGCGAECQHVKQVEEVFGKQLPPAALGSRHKPPNEEPGPASEQAGVIAVAAATAAAEPPAEVASPPPPSVRYPFPCGAGTADAMAAGEVGVASARLRAMELQASAARGSSSDGGSCSSVGGSGGGGRSFWGLVGQQLTWCRHYQPGAAARMAVPTRRGYFAAGLSLRTAQTRLARCGRSSTSSLRAVAVRAVSCHMAEQRTACLATAAAPSSACATYKGMQHSSCAV